MKENAQFRTKRIPKEEGNTPACTHGCRDLIQVFDNRSDELILECCTIEARNLSSLVMCDVIQLQKKENVRRLKEQEQEDRTVEIGDIFRVVLGNNHEIPYLISFIKGRYVLINMHSGQSNYEGVTLEELLQKYLKSNDVSRAVNPVTHYYFVKSYENKQSHEKNFGLTEL